MIQGLITGKHVLGNAAGIVRGYGMRAYLRCLWAVVSRRRTTFLQIVFAPNGW